MLHRSRQTWLIRTLIVTATIAACIHLAIYRSQLQLPTVLRHFSSSTSDTHRDWPPNYSRIEDGLWMGGFVDQPPAGTQAVLNVCESADTYRLAIHRWEPIHDAAPAPSLEWLDRQVNFIIAERNAGHAVYVHCFGGVSRSAMVVTAYFMRREGWTAKEALAFLRSKRPVVSPNPAFMALLSQWEQACKSGDESAGNTTRP